MISKIALRKFLLAISAACSELAENVGREEGDEVVSDEAQEAATNKGKKGAKSTKETKTPKTTKETTSGKGKKGKKDDEEMEEVDSPYNDDETSSDDPADFDNDDDSNTEDDDDFAGVEDKKPTVEDLRAALVAYAQKHSKDKAYAVLAKFKAKKANEVKEADIPKAIAALKIK